jgi:hypothetical protein
MSGGRFVSIGRAGKTRPLSQRRSGHCLLSATSSCSCFPIGVPLCTVFIRMQIPLFVTPLNRGWLLQFKQSFSATISFEDMFWKVDQYNPDFIVLV